MLVGFTVLSVGFYLLFVRPTIVANQFVAAVESGDYEAVESLCTGADPVFLTKVIKKLPQPVIVEVELAPQSWHSLFRGRRTATLGVVSTQKRRILSSAGASTIPSYRGYSFQVEAGVFGIYRVSGYSPEAIWSGN
jgi:hypothetical protein